MTAMRSLLFVLMAAVASLMLEGCISDDFTSSSSDTLAFSSAKVTFDTIFTDVGSTTARLKVYNHAKKSVLVSSIGFRNRYGNFKMNVDGVSGTDFRDVEIRGGDSIFVFIECFIDPNEDARPFQVTDWIDFVTNGVTQSVEVEAWGQNVVRLRGERIETDRILTPERPYVVFDSLVVAPGAALTLLPGTRLLFHDKAALIVRGRIEAVGAPGNMIQLRGDRLDNVLPDVPYDILAGQWEGVRIAAGSFGNRIEYVDMRSTSSGLRLDSCGVYDRTKLTLVNSWLHNSQAHVLEAPYCKTESYGVCYSDAAEAVVDLTGGVHAFSQCTFANEYLFAVPSQAIVSLSHCLDDPMAVERPAEPLMQARFGNCIIYGMAPDLTPGDLTGSDVVLERVSLRSAGSDDDNFIRCLWDTDPLFLTRREDYVYDYRVQPESPVVHAGIPSLCAPETYTDIDGKDRFASSSDPTLGAYAE